MQQHPKRLVEGFPDADVITNAELLELPVDVLFPALLEHVITRENAPRIVARMIVPLSNGPITSEAHEILNANGVIVPPNCLCGAGGVIVSYFEQVQNAANFYWPREQVAALLDAHISRAFHAVHDYAQAWKISYETAGCMLGVQRVAEAVALRGWVR